MEDEIEMNIRNEHGGGVPPSQSEGGQTGGGQMGDRWGVAKRWGQIGVEGGARREQMEAGAGSDGNGGQIGDREVGPDGQQLGLAIDGSGVQMGAGWWVRWEHGPDGGGAGEPYLVPHPPIWYIILPIWYSTTCLVLSPI